MGVDTTEIQGTAAGFTSFRKAEERYVLKIRKTRGLVLTAIHLGHELTHVQEGELIRRRALNEIFVNEAGGATKQDIVEYAGKALLVKKFGRGGTAVEEAQRLNEFQEFYARVIEQKAYANMLAIQKQIATKLGAGVVLDTETEGTPEFNSTLLTPGDTVEAREPLKGQALIDQVRIWRTDETAKKARGAGVDKWLEKTAKIPEGAIPEVARLLDQTKGDPKFEDLLLELGYDPALIPPNLKQRP